MRVDELIEITDEERQALIVMLICLRKGWAFGAGQGHYAIWFADGEGSRAPDVQVSYPYTAVEAFMRALKKQKEGEENE